MERERISIFNLRQFVLAMFMLVLSLFWLSGIIVMIIEDIEETMYIFIMIFVGIIFLINVYMFIHSLALATKVLIIDDDGITLKNIVFKIYSFKWSEIQNIYVLDFPTAQKYTVPRLARGNMQASRADINNHIKFPEKWIVVDNGRRSPLHLKNDNVKLQFLLSLMNINSVIKLKYNEDNMNKISKFFTKYWTNSGNIKTIRNISFNITDELSDRIAMNEFYVFLSYSNEDEELLSKKSLSTFVLEPLDKFVLPEFHEIWLRRRRKEK